MAFVTYENRGNPRVTVHLDGCGQIGKRGGRPKHGQGAYHRHSTYPLARAYAESTGLPTTDCSYCIESTPPAVRILPLNLAEFPACQTSAEVQQRFFLDELPSREGGLFRYRKRGLREQAGAVVLFQCENRIIASAVFLRTVPFDRPDGDGFEGRLSFDVRSIRVFDPIDGPTLRSVWPTFVALSHVRQSLEPSSSYPAFVRLLAGVQSPPARLRPDEAADEPFHLDEADRRPLVDRQIRERRGQTAFREALRTRYGDRCMVTGCTVLAVLEASHIKPYRGESDNREENGLLLRSDIHTLFDLDLLGIEPTSLSVELHPEVAAEYVHLAGTTLRGTKRKRPSLELLQRRYRTFQAKLRA